MAQPKNNRTNTPTDEAINSVLAAEKSAHQSIANCRDQAEQVLQQARQKTHRISESTDLRITRIHQRCSRLVTDRTNQMQRDVQLQLENQKSFSIDEATIKTVAENLARMLTEE